MKPLLIISFLFFTNLIFAQQDNSRAGYPKTITVEGSAEMSIVPDELYVQVQLKEYKKKGEDKVDIEKIKTDFLAVCKNLQIPDSLIKIGSYMGYNQNQFASKRKKKDPDLINTVMYQIKFYNTKKIEELVNLLDDEATAMFKIGRSSHTKITEFRKQLKIEAIKAAKQKAIYLAEAINEKVGEAIAIYEPEEKWTYFDEANESNRGSNTVTVFIAESDSLDGNSYKNTKLRFTVQVIFALK
jgi:uncharacterized protein YggE